MEHRIEIVVSENWVSISDRQTGRIIFQGDKAFLRDRAVMLAIVERVLAYL